MEKKEVLLKAVGRKMAQKPERPELEEVPKDEPRIREITPEPRRPPPGFILPNARKPQREKLKERRIIN